MIFLQGLNSSVTVSFSSIDPQRSPRNEAEQMYFLELGFLGIVLWGDKKYGLGHKAGARLLSVHSCFVTS